MIDCQLTDLQTELVMVLGSLPAIVGGYLVFLALHCSASMENNNAFRMDRAIALVARIVIYAILATTLFRSGARLFC